MRIVDHVRLPARVRARWLFLPAFAFFLHSQRLDALARHHHRTLVAGGLDQTRHPALLQAEPVDEDDLGVPNRLGVGGCWLEDMSIAIGADEGDNLNAVAADGFDHVAENTEAGDDLERRIGGLRPGAGEDGGGEREGGNGAESQNDNDA